MTDDLRRAVSWLACALEGAVTTDDLPALLEHTRLVRQLTWADRDAAPAPLATPLDVLGRLCASVRTDAERAVLAAFACVGDAVGVCRDAASGRWVRDEVAGRRPARWHAVRFPLFSRGGGLCPLVTLSPPRRWEVTREGAVVRSERLAWDPAALEVLDGPPASYVVWPLDDALKPHERIHVLALVRLVQDTRGEAARAPPLADDDNDTAVARRTLAALEARCCAPSAAAATAATRDLTRVGADLVRAASDGAALDMTPVPFAKRACVRDFLAPPPGYEYPVHGKRRSQLHGALMELGYADAGPERTLWLERMRVAVGATARYATAEAREREVRAFDGDIRGWARRCRSTRA